MSPELWLQPEGASLWTCFTLSFSTSLSLRAGADVKCIFCKKKMIFVFIWKHFREALWVSHRAGSDVTAALSHSQRFWLEREDRIDTVKPFKSSTLFAKVRLPTSGQLGGNICEVASYFSSIYLKQPRVFLRHHQRQQEGAPHFTHWRFASDHHRLALSVGLIRGQRTGSNISISS